jgi:glycosyltransferase involved in cell wall biosynthesis
MLSILIPIYRYDVTLLVKTLHKQAQKLPGEWEICLLDDASPVEWQQLNRPLAQLDNVRYEELPENVGRAKIRNLLAQIAGSPYLLFLDSDSAVEQPDFLATYYHQLSPRRVLCGGRNYASEPQAPEFHLHWWYGSQREVRPAEVRNQQPHHGFMTNNFVVPKRILEQLPFDETILTYGHEDTLFGHQLAMANIEVLHLDNPVVHIGLDEARIWLNKQRQAIENLHQLHLQYPALTTKALRWWLQLHRTRIISIIYPFLKWQAPRLQQQLLERERPNLRLLDLLKLLWLEEAHLKRLIKEPV